jgi:hypothetical protein
MWVVSEKPFLTQAWRYSRRISHVALSAKIKALATHRAKLGAHQPLYDHG